MDFEIRYTQEQESFRKEFRDWLEENLPKVPPRQDMQLLTKEELAKGRDFRRKLGERGWYAPTWPKEYGGGGLAVEYGVVIAEELHEYRNVRPDVYDIGLSLCSPALYVWGTEEQKQRMLKPVLTGDSVTWQLYSEPGAGSDLASLQTRAIRDGDEFVIDGQKLWIGGNQPPENFYLLAVTDPDGSRHNNLGAFYFSADRPGITVRPLNLVCRYKNEIFFENVRIPAACLIGGETDGWRVAQTTLEVEHGGGGAFVGWGQLVYDLIDYCKTTGKVGQPLSKNPDIARTLVDLYLEAQVGRLINLRNYWMRDQSSAGTYEFSQASFYGKRFMLRFAHAALGILGPHALTSDPKWAPLDGAIELDQRDSLATHGGGTPEVQQLVMARRIGIGRPPQEAAPIN